jgi:two-component system cell cycle sensor histidine kinase/response regulator CckA
MKFFDFLKTGKMSSNRPFQLSNLIEILQDGVCITQVTGEIIYINKAAYVLLGINETEDISQYNFFGQFVDDPKIIDYLKFQIQKIGLVRNYETRLKKKDGAFLDIILTLNVIGDLRQETVGYLFLFKDVTELKKIQQQLLQSQKLESIGLMASGIAHDFNNILAAIIPNSELIKLSSKPEEINFKRAEIIEKSAHRASEIAQRLLTFTRQSHHKGFEPINLNKIIFESLELMEHGLSPNVGITTNFEPKLKYFQGDDAQIQQIIMNLVINANDAMPKGGTIKIITENYKIDSYYQIGSLDPGEYVRLSILDNGSGIPDEVLSKIFDPFFTTKEIGKGTGLGLSVVYGIVRGLKGHIEVQSEIDKGTRFDIYFPVDSTVIKTVENEEIERQAASNIKIMIVDDEEYVLNILAEILDFLGYRIEKCSSGEDAVAYFNKNNNDIDFAIIDLKMPQMDGRQTSACLRQINPDLKIIFTSGFDDKPITEENLAGVVGFLKKPYSINQVSKSLKEMLSNK